MPLRAPLVAALFTVSVVVLLYAATVRRGPPGMREELAWEVAASGHLPLRTRIYAEQRLAEYPRGLRWLAPALADVHAADVWLRWAYWHEEQVPDFDGPPDFEVVAER